MGALLGAAAGGLGGYGLSAGQSGGIRLASALGGAVAGGLTLGTGEDQANRQAQSALDNQALNNQILFQADQQQQALVTRQKQFAAEQQSLLGARLQQDQATAAAGAAQAQQYMPAPVPQGPLKNDGLQTVSGTLQGDTDQANVGKRGLLGN